MLYFFSAAARPADVIVIGSSDDENDDVPDGPATSSIEANNNESDKAAPDEPARSENCQQTPGPTSDSDHIQSDQVPLTFSDTKNVSHETDAVDQNGTADAAALDEETIPSGSDDDENAPSTSSNVAEVSPPVEVEIDDESPEPRGPVPMKKCRLCPFVSRFRSNLQKHMHSHTGRKKPYKCHMCPKYFASPEEVEKHLQSDRHRFRFYCPGCARGFQIARSMIAHQKKCKKSRVYECYACHFTMHSLSNLEIHMRGGHTGDKPYKCSECFERYAYLKDLNVHLTVHAERNAVQLSDYDDDDDDDDEN